MVVSAEIYPDVVDGLENEGGVPSPESAFCPLPVMPPSRPLKLLGIPPPADVPINGSDPRIVSIRPVTVRSTVGTIVPTVFVTRLRICSIGPCTAARSDSATERDRARRARCCGLVVVSV